MAKIQYLQGKEYYYLKDLTVASKMLWQNLMWLEYLFLSNTSWL